jgi:hypothetical protein
MIQTKIARDAVEASEQLKLTNFNLELILANKKISQGERELKAKRLMVMDKLILFKLLLFIGHLFLFIVDFFFVFIPFWLVYMETYGIDFFNTLVYNLHKCTSSSSSNCS